MVSPSTESGLAYWPLQGRRSLKPKSGGLSDGLEKEKETAKQREEETKEQTKEEQQQGGIHLVRGQKTGFSFGAKDAVVVGIILVVVVVGVVIAFDVDVGGVEWEPPTVSASYIVSISSNSTSLDFTNGEIGWWPLDLSSSASAVVEINIAVFVNMTEGVYFQLAEYYPEGEEWVSEDMQNTGEKTWGSSVEIKEDETQQFAIWLFNPDGERRGTSCRFYLQSIGGKIVIGPV